MPILPLYCDICSMHIGSFDTDKIKLPLTIDQFGPISESHGKGFFPGDEYAPIKCNFCKRRPFQEDNKIRISPGSGDDCHYSVNEESGRWVEPVESDVLCPDCGKKFTSEKNLKLHKRFCKETLRLSRQAKESQNGKQNNTPEGDSSGAYRRTDTGRGE